MNFGYDELKLRILLIFSRNCNMNNLPESQFSIRYYEYANAFYAGQELAGRCLAYARCDCDNENHIHRNVNTPFEYEDDEFEELQNDEVSDPVAPAA